MARLKPVIIALLVLLSVFVLTHVVKFPGSIPYLREVVHGQPILDMKPSFSSAETYQRLESFGEIGRELYMRTMLTVDIVFPISVFIFLFLLSRYTAQRLQMKPLYGRALRSLPFIYIILDFLENLTVATLLSSYPGQHEFLAANIGYLTTGKRIAMFGAILIPVVLLVVASVSDRSKRKRNIGS